MRIDLPHHSERFGAVRIHGVQEVWELDSGTGGAETDHADAWHTVRHLPQDAITDVQRRMAIVVPCKSERLKIMDGVFSGIPHDCLIILVSASPREPIDRYRMECDTLERFSRLVRRNAVMIHQRDPGLGAAFATAGFEDILDDDGLVRTGKGEGMLVGLALARAAGKDYIGYVDADNYVPGAVHEYVKAYAAGIHLSSTPYSMVRISWRSKPKIQDGRLFFNRWGRSSQVTNHFINLLLSEYSGFGTEIVATGNAGEHAMSVELGMRMRFGSGFSVEPNQYMNLFEAYGGVTPAPYPEVMRGGVDIYQIETRNPHFHENKGSDHVQEMRLQALDVLYHSTICPDTVREEISELRQSEGLDPVPPKATTYPELCKADMDAFLGTLAERSGTFRQTAISYAARVVEHSAIELPIPEAPAVAPEMDEAGEEG
jgi:mannosyl-3-phosphoglycerate synthase